jgi:hypothetical protein
VKHTPTEAIRTSRRPPRLIDCPRRRRLVVVRDQAEAQAGPSGGPDAAGCGRPRAPAQFTQSDATGHHTAGIRVRRGQTAPPVAPIAADALPRVPVFDERAVATQLPYGLFAPAAVPVDSHSADRAALGVRRARRAGSDFRQRPAHNRSHGAFPPIGYGLLSYLADSCHRRRIVPFRRFTKAAIVV